ncbi:hypothetical protein [Desulfovibrio sp. X2]|uniref:hypothetical protein n=1 Tax=Desulfovibrio sp. X2 TaxID=941449 RepID=UPI00054D2D22|nr:hypothetical protein [Desulfovibrio sp. X2]
MAGPFKITTKATVQSPLPEDLDFIWATVQFWCEEPDETGAHPSLSVEVPLAVGSMGSIPEIGAAARAKARQLLGDALKAIQDG